MQALPGFEDQLPPGLERTAIYSPDKRHRYTLTRYWGRHHGEFPGPLPLHVSDPLLNVIMLNPSTADEFTEDPTIRRVLSFAQREGFVNVVITNLFALRSPHPEDLVADPHPIGPENDRYLEYCAHMAHQLWVAWGEGGAFRFRATNVERILRLASRAPIYCLGLNQSGEPRHPLYLKGDTPLQPYSLALA